MDNGSDEKKAINYLKKLVANSKIRIIKDISPFNYSKLNNDAVRVANGDVIALLNNDVEVINADWLTEMVSHAMRPEVGVVGAKLYYSDDTIQHAGVVLGIHGIAGHVHRFLPRDNVGYCGRANLIQSFSAVTGACLVVKKSTYQLVGGLNDLDLTVACNDIDFCLKVREAGYRNIWTPYAELYHHESASRGFDDTPEKLARSAKEVAYMQQRWGDLIKNDPAYSPNLSLDFEDFSLAWPPRLDGYNVN
jgi:O-antigen biosynthesis protein